MIAAWARRPGTAPPQGCRQGAAGATMIAAWARRLGTARRLSGVARAPPGATLVFDLDGTPSRRRRLCGVNVLLGSWKGHHHAGGDKEHDRRRDGQLADRALRATGGACAGEELASNAARLHDIYVDACCVDTYLYGSP